MRPILAAPSGAPPSSDGSGLHRLVLLERRKRGQRLGAQLGVRRRVVGVVELAGVVIELELAQRDVGGVAPLAQLDAPQLLGASRSCHSSSTGAVVRSSGTTTNRTASTTSRTSRTIPPPVSARSRAAPRRSGVRGAVPRAGPARSRCSVPSPIRKPPSQSRSTTGLTSTFSEAPPFGRGAREDHVQVAAGPPVGADRDLVRGLALAVEEAPATDRCGTPCPRCGARSAGRPVWL